jgi:peptidyl-Lys metalloendopeptidase
MRNGRALILAAIIGLAFAGALQAAPGLVATLEIDRDWFEGTEDVDVWFTLSNQSPRAVRVLKWELPLYGFERNLFAVTRDGERVPYTGMLIKRAAPRPQDYVEIAAGGELAGRIELTAVYDLRLKGQYTLRYHGVMRQPWLKAAPVEVASNAVSFWIEGRDFVEEPMFVPVKAQTPIFYYCSGSQQNSTTTALGAAEDYAIDSRDYLVDYSGDPAASERYGNWFGAYKASRWNSVKGNFTDIADALTNETFEFFCDCTMYAYAYVYANKPYEIHLCTVFWQAPTTGTDSKAGTIVHETSHFKAVAGTDDYAYGHSACEALAISNPRRATNNADSHEYFAENKPSLP